MKHFLLGLVLWLLPCATLCAEPVMLEFYSDNCPPCRQMQPAVDRLIADGYKVHRVNVSRNRALAARYRVESWPCFIVVDNGRELSRSVGLTSPANLRAMFQVPKGPAASGAYKGRPTSAWRYAKPSGHRASVVRIFCQDGPRTRSIGSGVLVRWRGRIVVLTARHVIQDAKKILIWFHNRSTLRARVLKVDSDWDCAVLQLYEVPKGVKPAEMEWGDAAMQKRGNRLESCGYGPDGKLAVNSGLFLGYRRSTVARNGPDDWMVISGHARGGDSGGPVFNRRGKVVGVLWGTDGREVVCVQAGRVHVTIREAVRYYRQNGTGDRPMVPVAFPPQRCPTPALSNPEDVFETALENHKQYILKFRNEIATQQAEMARQQRQMAGQLQGLQHQVGSLADAIRAQNAAPPAPQTPAAPPVVEEESESTGGPKTAAGRISKKGADWLADRSALHPISRRLAESASEKLESDSAGVRFIGWTQAKVAWVVFLGGIGLFLFAIHRLVKRALPLLEAKAAATANPFDDRIVSVLRRGHDLVDSVTGKVVGRVRDRFSDEPVPAEAAK